MARSSAPLWLATSSRFATLSRHQARLVLLLLVGLLLSSLLALRIPEPPKVAPSKVMRVGAVTNDLGLYEEIRTAMRGGSGYYPATAAALRANGYPLRPFVTFRLPALAMMRAWLPNFAMVALLYGLVMVAALAWTRRLSDAIPHMAPRLVAILLFCGSIALFLVPDLLGFHEIWAGLCVALSLALRRPGHWVEAVAFGLIAMLIRETSALYVLLMALLAWREDQRREALGWVATLGVLAVVLVFHAEAVWQVTNVHDPHSPGWSALLGFGFFVHSMTWATLLVLLPLWLAAPLVALALFGWACWDDALGWRTLVTLVGYTVLISCCARLDTFYWVVMAAPVFLLGLVFVPDGLRDLFVAAFAQRPRVEVRVIG